MFPTGLNRLRPEQARRHRRLAANPIANRLGVAPSGPPDMSALLPGVMDQGQSGSCVGHGGAGATYVSCNAAVAIGIPDAVALPFVPSPDEIYRLVRCRERLSKFEPLEDGGSNIADVLDVVTRFGVRPIAPNVEGRYSDVSLDTVNREPTLLDLEGDASTILLVVDAHPLASDPDEIEIALRHGAAVLIGVPGGSDAWQGYDGGVMHGGNGSPEIDHCVFVYRRANGSTDGQNSWGYEWGETGRFRMSDDFVRRHTGDNFALSIRRAA